MSFDQILPVLVVLIAVGVAFLFIRQNKHAAQVAQIQASAVPAPLAVPQAPLPVVAAPPGVSAPVQATPLATPAATIVQAPPVVAPKAIAAPVALTPAERDALAFKVGPGIAQDVSRIDPAAMYFNQQITYRQVDTNFKESISDSINFVKSNLVDNSGNQIILQPDKVYAGPVGVDKLATDYDFFMVYRMTLIKASWAYETLAGTGSQIRAAINRVGAGNLGAFNHDDWSDYAGVLKPYLVLPN